MLDPSSGSSSAIPLPPDSEDFGLCEYFLHLSLRSSRAYVRKAWSLAGASSITASTASAAMRTRFEERSKGLLVLPTWVLCNGLEESINSVSSVCERGFKVDGSGMVVQVERIFYKD